MPVTAPTPDQLKQIASDMGLSLTESDVASFIALMKPNVDAYNVVDHLPDDLPRVKYPRTPGYRPRREENQLQCLVLQDTVRGREPGASSGQNDRAQRQRHASRRADDERRLDAGGLYARRRRHRRDAHPGCRWRDRRQGPLRVFLSLGRKPHQCAGPVHNPHKMGYSAGGSSSGSAALVAHGEADMAIGGDQGGSIRMPASFCGIYGMKPTHGLVPYTGIMPIEVFVDHTGPMTANVRDNALLLEVLAGPDGYDPRQYDAKTQPVYAHLGGRGARDVDRRGAGGIRPSQLRSRRRRQCPHGRRAAHKLGARVDRGIDPHGTCRTERSGPPSAWKD